MEERLVIDNVVYEVDRGPEGTKYRFAYGGVTTPRAGRERLTFADMLPSQSTRGGLSFLPRVVAE